jgi:hypothetical protein
MKTLAVLLIALTTAAHAQAYTVTLDQVGSNVVANGSGAIDLTGLSINPIAASTSSMLDDWCKRPAPSHRRLGS